jgi:hypothetical protein
MFFLNKSVNLRVHFETDAFETMLFRFPKKISINKILIQLLTRVNINL